MAEAHRDAAGVAIYPHLAAQISSRCGRRRDQCGAAPHLTLAYFFDTIRQQRLFDKGRDVEPLLGDSDKCRQARYLELTASRTG